MKSELPSENSEASPCTLLVQTVVIDTLFSRIAFVSRNHVLHGENLQAVLLLDRGGGGSHRSLRLRLDEESWSRLRSGPFGLRKVQRLIHCATAFMGTGSVTCLRPLATAGQ